MDAALRNAFRDAVGARGFTDAAADMAPWLTDWRGRKRGAAALMLSPGTTAEVAAIVRLAAQHGIPLVPQGGNTSLAGASVPEADGAAVLVSLRRMNAIGAVDLADLSVTVGAGAILQHVQDAADTAGAMFPLSLAAKGSATIGGLVSTNAGGVQVLRYGTMRAQVLGLEAVLPDGSVLDQLSGLRKDNTGYDVKQLLIGAEGTLGFVTAAKLRLVPKPLTTATALVAVDDPHAALRLLGVLRAATADRIDSFELMPRSAFDMTLRRIAGTRDPFAAPHPWYVLVEATSAQADDALADAMTGALAALPELRDAVVAGSEAQRAALWRLREELPEAERQEGPTIKHDVSVPVSGMPDFIAAATAAVETGWPGTKVLAFGHLGDGNVHYNVAPPPGVPLDDYRSEAGAITRRVHDLVVTHGGSISAEHGIGTLKKAELARLGDPGKLAAMRALKAALDPRGIMNPGKLL